MRSSSLNQCLFCIETIFFQEKLMIECFSEFSDAQPVLLSGHQSLVNVDSPSLLKKTIWLLFNLKNWYRNRHEVTVISGDIDNVSQSWYGVFASQKWMLLMLTSVTCRNDSIRNFWLFNLECSFLSKFSAVCCSKWSPVQLICYQQTSQY